VESYSPAGKIFIETTPVYKEGRGGSRGGRKRERGRCRILVRTGKGEGRGESINYFFYLNLFVRLW
jgi:hypothetical protein